MEETDRQTERKKERQKKRDIHSIDRQREADSQRERGRLT
jgi:hypothetical protein